MAEPSIVSDDNLILKENLQWWRLPLQIIRYRSFRPFVNQSFCESRFGSLSTFESRFGSLCVGILIIASRHCSSDVVKCSADKLRRSATASQAQKRTQTGASPNACFTCFIFQYISLGFSIIQLTIYSSNSEEQPENRKNKENAASELSFNRSKFIFLHVFMHSQLVYRNI